MTTSTFGAQTDAPADLPMRPRGARRSAIADDQLFQEPAAEAPAEGWAETALQSLTADAGIQDVEEEPAAEPATETAAASSTADAALSADIPGEDAARAARAAADAAARDLGLGSKSAELLHSLLVLSATDLSRGYPWRVHKMSARDWYEGFLFEDASSWLLGVGEAFSMRAFRTAMSGAEALAAFNSLSLLCLTPGVREETSAGVQKLLADPARITRVLEAARI